MNSDPAELAIRPQTAARSRERSARRRAERCSSAAPARRALAARCGAGGLRLRADPQRGCRACATAGARCGARGCWSGLAGVGTLVAFGFGPARNALQPARRDARLRLARQPAGRAGGALGRGLVSGDRALRLPPRPRPVHRLARRLLPAVSARRARDLGALGLPPVLAGVLLSLVRAGARAVRHPPPDDARARRATRAGTRSARERASPEAARLAVLVTAFAPMAFFFSAVYSESLYLALSVGLFWSARHGRWACVGVLGALGAAPRAAPASCCCCRR